MSFLNDLLSSKIIAILRNIPEELTEKTLCSLKNGGIRFAEITLNSDNALNSINAARIRFGEDMYIGAGTVLNAKMAKDAISAGAMFIITPNLDIETVHYCVERGVDIWPGTMTPTEIVAAVNNGANAVKLFPAASLGAGYVKEIRAPLNNIPLIATGGIRLSNLNLFLQAGCEAFGIGSSLVDMSLISNFAFDELTMLCGKFLDECNIDMSKAVECK